MIGPAAHLTQPRYRLYLTYWQARMIRDAGLWDDETMVEIDVEARKRRK